MSTYRTVYTSLNLGLSMLLAPIPQPPNLGLSMLLAPIQQCQPPST